MTTHMLSSGLTNSVSENPLSESSATSCPHISGNAAEFWTWLDEPTNAEWAIAAFPVEKGYSDRNIFVSKLPSSFQDRDLQSMFKLFGEVVSAKVMLNVSTGASKETGFVQFATAKDALRARCFLRLRPAVTEPPMPEVETQWAQKKHDGGVYGDRSRLARKLFIRNIPVSVTNEEVRALVTKFGDVAEVTLHADTYDAAATSSSSRGGDSGEEASCGEVATPPSPKPTVRICFVTFLQAGVAARACAAIHNTKPFCSCGAVPLMAKIAEDNNARQARHQQGLQHRSDILSVVAPAAAVTPAASAVASPTATTVLGQRPSFCSGPQRQNGHTSPMGNAGWCQFPLPQNNANQANMVNNQQQQPMSAYPDNLSPSFQMYWMTQPQGYNGVCGPVNASSSSPSTGSSTPTKSVTRTTPVAAAAAVNGATRLTFSPHPPQANVRALDPAALAVPAASDTPRALSTATSPFTPLPVAAALDSRRPSRLTLQLSSPTFGGKPTRIPVTTTSAPTSARRGSREMLGRSPLGFGAERARTMSCRFSNSASGVYSAAEQSSPVGVPAAVLQKEVAAKQIRIRVQGSRSNSVSTGGVAAAKAVHSSPRPTNAHLLSSRSSDTTSSHDSGTHNDGAQSRLNVHVSPSHHFRAKQKFRPQLPQRSCATAAAAAAFTQESPFPSSPYASSQAVPCVGLAPMIVTAVEEAIVSPYSSAFAAGRNTSNVTPTCVTAGGASQTRYRNNPYGVTIVLGKTKSSTFAEV
jgi:hypothetical protein